MAGRTENKGQYQRPRGHRARAAGRLDKTALSPPSHAVTPSGSSLLFKKKETTGLKQNQLSPPTPRLNLIQLQFQPLRGMLPLPSQSGLPSSALVRPLSSQTPSIPQGKVASPETIHSLLETSFSRPLLPRKAPHCTALWNSFASVGWHAA